MNAYLLLEIATGMVPEQEILTFGDERQTYSQLMDNTGSLAAALASSGIGQGDRIGLIATNCSEMIEIFFAAFQLGAVIVPINYRAKVDELSFMIQDAGIKVLFLEPRYVDLITPFLPTSGIQSTICIGKTDQDFLTYDAVKKGVTQPHEGFADVESGDLAVLLYTSGTTSKPKGVMITHGQLTNYVMGHSEVAGSTDQGSSIVCIPNYHIAGATSICNAIYSGRRLVLIRQFEAGEWLHSVEKEQVNHAFMVPTMLKQVMDHPDFSSTDLSSLENLSYGAAPMPLPVIRKAIELFPDTTNFANGFGMTETTSTVSVLTPEDHKLTGTSEEIETKIQRLSSVGKPLPGVEIMVVDDDRNPVEAKTIGNVYVRTGRSMKGYWKRPEASKETLVDGWINTEDMGWLDEDGYLFLCGRSSDMIIRGGENISPAEIEDVFFQHPTVADVAVVGVPSLEWGEEVLAVIVAHDIENPPPVEELMTHCREHLASFKRPSEIRFESELPRNSTGKILKRTLREQFTPANEAYG
ncbi:long-chain-fatty-acid--CoA ligase [Sporosarcina sp. FSL K6-1522]|uniref:class I adenylate-forming enzyme family protein n=1 Tax=Sporosarcina sp. FSL K6-1522 TaxID=2921554 RepID=UPI00315B0ACF